MSKNKLEAVLWDLDGVIADTGEYHYRAWQYVFREKGVTFSKEDFMRHFGQRHDTIIRFALGDGLSTEEFEAVTEKKQREYRRIVAENIKALPGAIELIRSLNENNIKTAIASSAPMENIKIIIKGLKIEDCFQAIASGLEVDEGKPSPQIFLLAADKLGVEPGNCVVMEDAIAGVAAAKTAGMKCLAVTNSHPVDRLEKADVIVDSLEKVGINELVKIFNSSAP
jgi:beta-phosphoglucomutase family hydrolase